MIGTRFVTERLDEKSVKRLSELARLARGDILKMTTLAGSGHPGGSMSSVDFYLILYSYANVHPQNSADPDRDRIVISHGHTSPGVYAALGRLGFFPTESALATFRKAGARSKAMWRKEFQESSGIAATWGRDCQRAVALPSVQRY